MYIYDEMAMKCANIVPLYPLQDFKALYKYCIIIIITDTGAKRHE